MTPFTAAILAGLVFGLCSAFVLTPLASQIPNRLHQQWAREVHEYSDFELSEQHPVSVTFTALQKVICIDIAALLGFAVVSTYGTVIEALALACYFLALLLLAMINTKVFLLPDVVVMPALWLGLLFYTYVGAANEHVYGAAIGYLAPLLLMSSIHSLTRKNIMGRGDFKAMAMTGAWVGCAGLPLFFGGFLAGFVVWMVLTLITRRKMQGLVSTGPAHLIGAVTAVFGKPALMFF